MTATYCGTARNVEWREITNSSLSYALFSRWGPTHNNSSYYSILAFRIEQTDPTGMLLNQIPVEIADQHKPGTLRRCLVEGDEVEVIGSFDDAGMLIPEQIRNLKTQALVIALPQQQWIWMLVFLLILLAVLAQLRAFL
jgi:hypothetical protein